MKYKYSYETRPGQRVGSYVSIPEPTAKDFEDIKKLKSFVATKTNGTFSYIELPVSVAMKLTDGRGTSIRDLSPLEIDGVLTFGDEVLELLSIQGPTGVRYT